MASLHQTTHYLIQSTSITVEYLVEGSHKEKGRKDQNIHKIHTSQPHLHYFIVTGAHKSPKNDGLDRSEKDIRVEHIASQTLSHLITMPAHRERHQGRACRKSNSLTSHNYVCSRTLVF